MFRNDRCNVKRPSKTKVNGEIIYGTPAIIASNMPCHLSVKTLSSINQSNSTATVLYDFVLFYDISQNITIDPNDIIEVTTEKGQTYTLRAGESKKYPLTVQTHCEKIKVA